MATCRDCRVEVSGSDRFCRNCGAPIPEQADGSESGQSEARQPLHPDRYRTEARPKAAAGTPTDELTQPFYSPPSHVTPFLHFGTRSLHLTRSFLTKSIERGSWLPLSIVLVVLLSVFGGVGIIIGKNMQAHRQDGEAAGPRVQNDSEDGDGSQNEEDSDITVKNALGFEPGDVSNDEYPTIDGVFVQSLTRDDGPAALAQIQAGDVVMQIGGEDVSDSDDIAEAISSLAPGASVAVKIFRDGQTIASSIRLGDRSHAPLQPVIDPTTQGFLGLNASRHCCIPGTGQWGLQVDSVTDNSPADLAGLQPGDLIVEFDGHSVRTAEELARRVHAAKPRSKVPVKILRANAPLTIEVVMAHGSDEDPQG